jgi:hypothetical protein
MSKNMTWDERLAIMEATGVVGFEAKKLAQTWDKCAMGELFGVEHNDQPSAAVRNAHNALRNLPANVIHRVMLLGVQFCHALTEHGNITRAREIYNELKDIKAKYG